MRTDRGLARQCSAAVACVLVIAPSALCADAVTSGGDSTFDIKQWIAICAGLGTLTTAIVNVVRWGRERSANARKVETISRALKLTEFIGSEKELGTALGIGSGSQTAMNTARMELRAALASLDPTPRPVSRIRRLALFYAPRGWRAWVAHSMFYAVCLFCGAFAVASYSGDFDEFEYGGQILGFLFVVSFGILFERWATLEYRIYNNLALDPKPIGPFFWYPANNRFGLLAQVMLVLAFVRIVSFVAAFALVNVFPLIPSPFPSWELAVSELIRSAFLPVGYLWAEMEYNYSKNLPLKRTLNVLLKLTFKPRTGEEFIGTIAFAAITTWNIVLLFGLRSVPRFAAFPDDTGSGQVGIFSALLVQLLLMAGMGWLPWLAIWRGLWTLYRDDGKLSERPAQATTEDPNG